MKTKRVINQMYSVANEVSAELFRFSIDGKSVPKGTARELSDKLDAALAAYARRYKIERNRHAN